MSWETLSHFKSRRHLSCLAGIKNIHLEISEAKQGGLRSNWSKIPEELFILRGPWQCRAAHTTNICQLNDQTLLLTFILLQMT